MLEAPIASDKNYLISWRLRAGDEVYRADGSYDVGEAVSSVYHPQGMYNLTIEGARTCSVGLGQRLVHTACPGRGV